MTSFVNSIVNSTNPFVMLVKNVTADDGSSVVTAHDQEKVLEACHQSDFGLEWTFNAITERLDHKSHQVRYKALVLIRLLLLEGPAAFSSRMGKSLQRMHELAHREYADVPKNSVEAGVRNMADAIHKCCSGDGVSALQHIGDGSASGGASSAGKFKSAYHQEQVKELAKWRKKQHEERGAGVVIQDKNYLTFKAELTPQKLIESVLNAEKKKFAPEEVFSFVDAAVGNAKPADVCALMDKVTADARYSIAQRHKMLQMVEGLVMTQGTNAETGMPSEVGQWWRGHMANLRKVTTLEAPENPAKAQHMQAIAKRVLEHLTVLETAGNVGGGAAGGGGGGGSAIGGSFGGGSFGCASSSAASSAAAAAVAAAPSPAARAAAGGGGSITPPQVAGGGGSQQRGRGSSVSSSQSGGAVSASSGAGSGTTWQPAFGMTNINPAFAVDSGAAANAAGGDMFGGMAVSRKTGVAPAQPADIFSAPAPAPAGQALPPPATADADAVKALQEQLARNMEMMAKLTVGAQPAAPPAQQQAQQQEQQKPAGAWGSSVMAPPPIVVPDAAPHPSHIESSPAGVEVQQPPQEQTQGQQHVVDPAAAEDAGGDAQEQREPDAEEVNRENSAAASTNGAQEGSGLVAWSKPEGGSEAEDGSGAAGAGSFAASQGTASCPSVPNNSMVDGGAAAALMAQMAAMTAVQQTAPVAAVAAAAPRQSRGNSPTASEISAAASAAHSGGAGGSRTHEDHMLIAVLQQQLKSAQDQITAQNQMIAMMQQQIQMLMTQKQ